MNKFKILGVAFLAGMTVSYAQNIDQAKKEIDAEKYQDAKVTLKSIVKSDPSEGKAFFLLGNVYLYQNIADSAKMSYQSGLTAKNDAHFNYIGLGQLDLDNSKVSEAKAKFDLAIKEMRRKDFEEYVYVARAYMNSNKPDFKSAIATLNLAKEKNGQEPQVLLAFGDAYYGDKNQNEAYSAYRNAFQADNSLIRAKVQLGVLLKGAKAYTEAVNAYNEVLATNPNYGPLYRELAETYYLWALNVPGRQDQYLKQALGYYEKYMTLTDYSLASRMRHADFLILAKDYKALEVEADKMKELDKVNPRIYRYLGYSAYQNDNVELAIKSLEDYIANPSNKVINLDYLYLGLSNLKKGTSADGSSVDPVLFEKAIGYIKKAVEMEVSVTNELGEVGKNLYEQKLYKEAAAVLEIATSNPDTNGFLYDNYYLGNAIYFDNAKPGIVKDTVALKKADIAYGNVIKASPDTQDVYLSRARTNSLLEDDKAMIMYYQQYVDLVTKKGPEELAKPAVQTKLIECYNSMAAGYANFDKAKAKEYFAKTLAIDPTNAYATQSLKLLK
ncbi:MULTISPECIES: tetratricopeptide repeat protein [unclassified Flavobacterium]|uniref:tetratricopeptide repeat protein n=1 Tax=unclassified Flavobacterium TaxID=196869 RepID=UPI003F925C53